jgi:hypothetical protein
MPVVPVVLGRSQIAWPSTAKVHVVSVILPPAIISDATKTVTLILEVSHDGGLTFLNDAKAVWFGGGKTPDQSAFAPPTLVVRRVGVMPTHVAARLEGPAALAVPVFNQSAV